jgi:hypothetical protein
MEFYSDPDRVLLYLKKWKLRNYALFLFVGFFYFLNAGIINHKQGSSYLYFYFPVALFFIWLSLRPVFAAMGFPSTAISYMKITQEEIVIKTTHLSMFGGLLRKPQLEVKGQRKEVSIQKYSNKSDFTDKYLHTMYLLKIREKEYLLPENFFDDFENLLKHIGDLTGQMVF